MINIESKGFDEIEADVLIVNMFQGETSLAADLVAINKIANGVISSAVTNGDITGSLYEVSDFVLPGSAKVRRLLLVGSGTRETFNFEVASRIAGTAARQIKATNVKAISFLMRGELSAGRKGQACVEGTLIGFLDMGKYKTKKHTNLALESILLLSTEPNEREALKKGGEFGRVFADATNYARNLVNEPSNILTPNRLAEEVVSLAERYGMEVEIVGPDRMKELGMNAILNVGKGSCEPPELCILKYRWQDSGTRKLALVGKGLTFDSGGISLKKAEGMHYMKSDMAGGAAVLGAMRIVGEFKPEISVLGIVAAAENLPGGRAQKPGDVVKAFNGKTIEVVNTDAEGRLVLADALSYAAQLGATHIIDIATLTGSCVIALGDITTGIMSNDEKWAAQVVNHAASAGEKVWLLPTFPEYRELIESEIADVSNMVNRSVAHSGVNPAGAIVGAMFLKEFVGNASWIHMDIAGTAWNSRKLPYLATGPTGVGVRTLASLVLASTQQEGTVDWRPNISPSCTRTN
jgi:leucyl aminopeptidase